VPGSQDVLASLPPGESRWGHSRRLFLFDSNV
jgi:hypothetical protein